MWINKTNIEEWRLAVICYSNTQFRYDINKAQVSNIQEESHNLKGYKLPDSGKIERKNYIKLINNFN